MFSDTHDRHDLASNIAVTALFTLIVVLVATDLAFDVRSGTTGAHAAIEGLIIAAGLAGAVRFAKKVRELGREARELRRRTRDLGTRLDASQAEAARWRRDAAGLLAGLSAAIDEQLERWGLTPAEKEVALLLLKGLSHKEIAEARAVNETTARHQARSVYRKAGLTGRNDLAAFFLEDLLGPHGARAR